ncbi:hypothetical protein DCAR_0205330 [Daucus carota subsp. sativus]|uniref:Transcription repressor n=1 Tax=Daucus carota subsp. sativus TaxID=79200 RepID=A0AAF1AK38_DAUCS|nr:hypothetical protein DCAR_0205330 [Daucus carota subsp. sativus]
MQGSRELKKQKLQVRGCKKALCCSCRLSVSSSDEGESVNSSRFATISSVAHAMVQEKLDQMIRERREARHEEKRKARRDGTKFVLMVAAEKSSYDPREDFRRSMMEMITANRIFETRDLRSLLNYYVSMNSEEYRGLILEVFHEVCTYMAFLKLNIPLSYVLVSMISPSPLRCKSLDLGRMWSKLENQDPAFLIRMLNLIELVLEQEH